MKVASSLFFSFLTVPVYHDEVVLAFMAKEVTCHFLHGLEGIVSCLCLFWFLQGRSKGLAWLAGLYHILDVTVHVGPGVEVGREDSGFF